jgi:hypothetical protein
MLVVRLAFLLSFSAILANTAAAQSIDDILSKHFEARGGLEKIKSLNSVVMHGRTASDAFELPIHFYCIHQKAFKVELEFEGRKYYQTGTPTEGWTFSPNQPDSVPHEMTPEELQEGQQYFDLQGPFIDYKSKGNKIEYIGTKEVNGQRYSGLKVIKASGEVFLYYLDDNYQIFQTIETEEDGTESITTYTNYKKTASGLAFPFTWAYGPSTTHIDTILINPSLDISLFKIKK